MKTIPQKQAELLQLAATKLAASDITQEQYDSYVVLGDRIDKWMDGQEAKELIKAERKAWKEWKCKDVPGDIGKKIRKFWQDRYKKSVDDIYQIECLDILGYMIKSLGAV